MTPETWLRAEGEACLAQIEAIVAGGEAGVDSAQVHRAVRRLHGVARLTDAAPIAASTSVIVDATRPGRTPADVIHARLIDTIGPLRALLAGGADASGLQATVRDLWQDGPPAAADVPAEPDEAGFIDWAAREIADFAEVLDQGIAAFHADPASREGLATILHRLRTLLGAARLVDVPVVGETLIAVDELTQLIVRLDVPVKVEWLDVYRTARETLRAAVSALAQAQVPQPVPALSRLRTLRTELLDRYGAREAEAAAAPPAPDPGAVPLPAAAPFPDAAVLPAPDPAAQGTPDPAARADALRRVIEASIGHDARARAALDELIALLRGLA